MRRIALVLILLSAPGLAGAVPLVVPTAVVAADNPTASRVGVEILQRGGNAIDAAVAVGLTLGVVNPFASGIGGGGFLLYRDAASGEVVALDFRETAPGAAHRDMYLGPDGQVVAGRSTFGGLAVAVPGEAAGWFEAHARYGALPWAEVVEPARALAEDGFTVERLLELRLAADARFLEGLGLADEFLMGSGTDRRLPRAGDTLTRPRLAWTLGALATHGPDGFYRGPVAEDLVASVRDAGGVIDLADLASYAPRWLTPVTSTYRGLTVHGMPPPSSGGLVVALVLRVLDTFALHRASFEDAIVAHVVAQAFAHAFADRAELLGDPSFVDVPNARFLSDARRDEVLAAYDPVRTLPASAYGATEPAEDAGTSHFSIVDAAGNAAACTVTVNTVFGAHVVTARGGIVLNNEMDDFAAAPGVPNAFGLVGSEANAIAAGKRPLSSMSPTIITDEAGVVGVLGGSGGPMIITETVLGVVQMVDFGRTTDTAVAAPRFHHQWLPFVLMVEAGAPGWDGVTDFGYEIEERTFTSALQIVWRHAGGWQAASDPRKLGAPAGY